AIDPVNPQLMYAGDPAGHLYKTLNGWSTSSRLYLDQAHPEASFQLQGIAIDPLAPANLYVAAGLDGAFRSTDAGATWTPAIAWPGAYPGLTVSGISVVRLPGDARRVFAATNYGVFLSDDGAMTWTQANMPLGLFYAHTVVADPRTVPATFYAAAFDGVHTSTDSGRTWSAALAPAGAVSTNVFSIVVDPRAFSQGTVYAGVQNGGGVWTSMNGGANWQTFSDDLTAMDVQALAAVGGDANRFRLLAATFYIGWVFRRECACDPSFLSSWLESDTGMGAHINAVAVDPLNPQTIYATATSGVYRGIEDQAGNISWTRITSGLTGGWVTGLAVDPLTLGTIWAGVGRGNGGVFKSVDSGTNWTQVKPILPNSSGGWLRALALAPSSPGTVYAGTTRPGNSTGVFRSTDGGTNWTGPVGSASLTSPDVVALAVAPQSPNLVYAGTSFGGLFTSVDWGGTWTPANNGLTNSSVYALAIDPINANRMFAGTWGGGLFTSLDGASTWSPVAGVNLSWISAVAVAPSDAQSVYAAGGSVSRTTDGGATWRKLPDGLPGAGAVSLAVHPTSPATIYVGTNSGGVYASTFTDFAPPTTSAATSPALSGGWAKAAATVTLTAADESGGSGVKQIDYRLLGAQSGGATVVGTTATIEVTTEGPTTVEYWATDNAGNQESPHKTLQVGIDTRAPSASAQLMGPPPVVIGGQNWYTQNITVNVWGQDDFSQGSWSGVRQIWYSSSGAQIAPWTSVFGQNASVVVSADGTTSVSYYAEDY
ncbi:MAG: hypothetical protein NTY02_19375, partial [Acidobacteria bacterium]|nr:hypothetical protein [Acidobacteriota bacterium]